MPKQKPKPDARTDLIHPSVKPAKSKRITGVLK